jgi:hypothetical protein
MGVAQSPTLRRVPCGQPDSGGSRIDDLHRGGRVRGQPFDAFGPDSLRTFTHVATSPLLVDTRKTGSCFGQMKRTRAALPLKQRPSGSRKQNGLRRHSVNRLQGKPARPTSEATDGSRSN